MLFVDALTVLLPYATEFIPIILKAFEGGDKGKANRELVNAIIANTFEENRRRMSNDV
jgi:hypothetical protein